MTLARPPSTRGRPRGERALPYLLVLPTLVLIGALALLPLLYGVWLSFGRWDLLSGQGLRVGTLENYARLLQDSDFWRAFVRTLWWTLGTVAFQVIVGLGLALLLNRPTFVAEKVSALILLPWVTPFVVIVYAWLLLLDGSGGVTGRVLAALNLPPLSPLASPLSAFVTVTLISGWKGTPFMVIALLAALKSIPAELYEAARVDGATPGQALRFVTLPLLRNTLVVTGLILGILAFYNFDLPWLMTAGGPGEATTLIGVAIYQTFFIDVQPTYAAAMGTVMLLVLLVLALLSLRLRRAT